MVITRTRARYRFTPDQHARAAALGIAAHDDHRFTTDEYDRMIEAGVIREGTRVELIEGEIVEMAPMGHRHFRCISLLNAIISDNRPTGSVVSVQCPILLTDNSEPEPDLMLVRDLDMILTKATPADILFLIEVADTTIDEDRHQKLPRYARAGIAEAWLVDINAGIIERHSEPRDGQYGQKATAHAGESLASTVVPGIVIPVADVLR